MPRIGLISDLDRAFDVHADARNVAMIKRRHAFWAELARLQSWNIGILNAHSIVPASNDLRDNVCWIDLPMLPRDNYSSLFARIASTSPAIVLDHPHDIERVLGLDQSYPILLRAGIPTPRTAFVSVNDDIAAAIDSPASVRQRLTDAIYSAIFSAEINPHDGIFIRGFYSSVKSANPEHYFGNNQADIEATVFEVIRHLRFALDVGGLALREHLDLERIEISTSTNVRDTIRLPFELRITVIGGRALMASYHGPFEVLTNEPRKALERALKARRADVHQAISTLAPALLAADLPFNYVADLAFVRGKGPVVLELNPLYASGYNVPAAHALVVAALGSYLAEKAGYAHTPWPEVLDIAAQLAGERIEESPAVWLFDRR